VFVARTCDMRNDVASGFRGLCDFTASPAARTRRFDFREEMTRFTIRATR